MEVRHRSFNPIVMGFGFPTTLSGICSDMEKGGWELSHIVPHTQYEHVAVFKRGNYIVTG
jgi:hypothetical protein